MPALLTSDERAGHLERLADWSFDVDRQAIFRSVAFEDFPQTLSAMVDIGFAAERVDHHPEWSNIYNRLDIWLTTHDAGGVSMRDVDFATAIDLILSKRLMPQTPLN